MDPPADVRLVLVVDRCVAMYSGMVPGFVAGDYALHELEIDVLPLARRANAGVIVSAARDLDPVRKEIALEGRPPLRFDFASIDVGSTVRGLDLPGVAEHALATRPIGDFVRAVDARMEAFKKAGSPPRILIVGGGAAGTELAFTIDARLRRAGIVPSVSIVTGDAELMSGSPRRTRRVIRREVASRGIRLHPALRVIRVEDDGVVVVPIDGADPNPGTSRIEADLVVWAAGAAPVAFPECTGATCLSRDATGFLEIRDTLQVVGFDDVFAAGDCARMVNHPWVPRAGVYAVREGPILEANLRARLEGRPLRRYRPQRDFLSLLNLGHGRAVGSKWGFAFAGSSLYRLKDRIDRQFMALFQVLDEAGRPRPELASLGAMSASSADGAEAAEMMCGGCAAKLGAEPLSAALAALPAAPPDSSVLLGLDERDDVAATRDDSERVTLHNIDVIRAFCDDPWLVGRVAAVNALSDLHAKGGRPRHAQAILGLPEVEPHEAREILFQALSGVRSILDPEGVSLLGGHTTIGDELTVGLSVTGDGPEGEVLLRQAGAEPGDDLLLTSALGTGVVLAADRLGRARCDWVLGAYASMAHLNRIAGRLAWKCGAHAATDVTGFGLAGHLLTLLDAADRGARIDRNAVPLLPGAAWLWSTGLRSTADPANRAAFSRRIAGATAADEAWLFDPQTAGGLLLAVAPDRSERLIAAFVEAGEPTPSRIGRIVSRASTDGPDRRIAIEIVEGESDVRSRYTPAR